jgi:hypothetical protein
MDPTFVRVLNGAPLATLENTMANRCFQLIDGITGGKMLPEYVILVNFMCAGQDYCMDTCFASF